MQWMDDATFAAITAKGIAYARWSRNKGSQQLLQEYRTTRAEASRRKKKAWSTYWSKWASDVDHALSIGNTRQAYSLLERAHRPKPCRMPTDESDLDNCRTYFKNLLQEAPPRPTTSTPLIDIRCRTPDDTELPGSLFHDITWPGVSGSVPDDEECRKALDQLRDGAPGRDGMRAAPIKASQTLRKKAVKLLQETWLQGRVPPAWQEAVMVAIPKKGGSPAWPDHRGITLLAVTSKLLSRVIHNRARNVPILSEQHGFRPDDGTTAPIVITKHLMQQARKCGAPLVLTFIDIQKAYDWIPREVLYTTLSQYGFHTHVISLLKSLYTDSIFMRLGKQTATTPFSSVNGVRQGCPLSPLLFNIIMDRVLRTAIPSMRGVTLSHPTKSWTIKCHAYADDIVIYSNNMTDAQHDLDTLSAALAAAGMTISVKKTNFIRQTENRRAPPTRPTHLPNSILDLDGTLVLVVPPGSSTACPCCPTPTTISDRSNLSRHLLTNHNLEVSIAKRPPHKIELTPTFRRDGSGRFACPHCHKTFASTSTAKEHWTARHCHDTPPFSLGHQYVIGSTPLRTNENKRPPIAPDPLDPLDSLLLQSPTHPNTASPSRHQTNALADFDGNLFLLLPKTASPQCPLCRDPPLSCASALTRHLHTKHQLTVTVGKAPPRKLEVPPKFPTTPAGKPICPHCLRSFASLKTVTEHWIARTCKHPTAQYAHGYKYLVGNTELPTSPPPHPPIASLRPPELPPLHQSPPRTQSHTTTPPISQLTTPCVPQPDHLTVYGEKIVKVKKFKYLGRILTETDDDSPAIADRIAQAAHAFWSLHRRFLAKKHVTTKTKLSVVKTIIHAKIVYAAESWVVKEHDAERLRALQQKLLRHALAMHPKMTPQGLRYPSRASVLAAAGQPDIVSAISHAQLRLAGHMLRRPPSDAAHLIWGSTIPLPGRVGFVDANLLRHRTLSLLQQLRLSPADALDRTKWRSAIHSILDAPPTTPAPAPATASSAPISVPAPAAPTLTHVPVPKPPKPKLANKRQGSR